MLLSILFYLQARVAAGQRRFLWDLLLKPCTVRVNKQELKIKLVPHNGRIFWMQEDISFVYQ